MTFPESPAAAALSRYTVVLADTLTDGVIAAELPLASLRYSLRLNDTGYGSFSVPARALATIGEGPEAATEPGKRTVYLYRDDVPVHGGVVTFSTYQDESAMIDISFSDWFWLLDRRVVLPDPATLPPANIAERAVLFSNVEQCDIVRELIRLSQLGTNRDLKIVCSTGSSGQPRDRSYYGYDLRIYGTVLRQLANVIDGCDLRFTVTAREGFATPQRTLLIGTPYLGSHTASGAVWEPGTNVFNYEFPRDPSDHADRCYAVGDGAETATPVAYRDRGELGYDLAGWPAMDAVDSYSNTGADRLAELALDELMKRRGHATVLGVDASGYLDPAIGSFEIGQFATFTAENPFHTVTLSTRCIGLDVEISEEEGETVTPLLNPVKS